jgi:hypothetical protein
MGPDLMTALLLEAPSAEEIAAGVGEGSLDRINRNQLLAHGDHD